MRFDHHVIRTTRKFLGTLLASLVLTLLFSISLATLQPTFAQSGPTAIHGTTIVVDTSADLTPTSSNATCTYADGAIAIPSVDGCTLRRAILEASARPTADRPITITFSLPMTDANMNLEVNGTWTLPLEEPLVLDRKNTLDLDGLVTIDGNTQPGGRSDGPKIIINTNDNSFEIESEDNIITNLAFKGGGVIFLKEDGNTVRNIWMGLTDDGQEIHFRTPGNEARMAGGGVHISSDNNLVEDSTMSGAFAKAVDIDGGDNNVIQNNQIGTRADGTVPTVPPLVKCLPEFDPADWYGGWGIALSGSNNQILNNRIAGLNSVRSTNDTVPLAIEIFGADHTISGNIIGVDSDGKQVGVCGLGIKASSTTTEILNNQVVGSGTSFEADVETAITGSGAPSSFNRVTLRGNIVDDGPGEIYDFSGTAVLASLRTFEPAKVTSINGTTVSGTAGDDSPCPGCTIDLYTDDLDSIAETLTYLGSTVADDDGNWTFNMGSALDASTGIRTSSTLPSTGIITSYGAGTTTKFSKLFYAMQSLTISGPITGVVGTAYTYTVSVGPVTATVPIDYAVQATDKSLQTVNDSTSHVIAGSYNWATPGTKIISATAENDLGVLMTTLEVEITDPTVAMSGVVIDGPTTGVVGQSYEFSITVAPSNATGPFDYTVNSTGNEELTLDGSPNPNVTATLGWNSPGVKTITATVESPSGQVVNTFEITISDASQSGSDLFMPKLEK